MDIPTPVQSLLPDEARESAKEPAIIATLKQPFEKKPKFKLWQIAAVVALGLALVLGIIVFFLNRNTVATPQNVDLTKDVALESDATQSWATYTNAKNQFSIDHPSDWTATESPSGDGVTFKPKNSLDSSGESDDVTAYVGQKTLTEEELTFEEYAKVAAVQEIQNYNSLASIEPITLSNGMVGYKTTWMVQSLGSNGTPETESAPIAYFQVPGSETLLLRISSGYDVEAGLFDRMVQSVSFSPSETAPATATPTPTATPNPAVDEEAALKATIKQQILADSEDEGGSLTVSVSQIAGAYAKGMASDDGGGGLWFAAKVNGAWKLVWDGNGIIMCSDLTEYPNFPTSMIPECYDQVSDNMVKR